MGCSVDKRLKIDEPLGTIYLSHKPHPIKVAIQPLVKLQRLMKLQSKLQKPVR
jgi:hypothetical protein